MSQSVHGHQAATIERTAPGQIAFGDAGSPAVDLEYLSRYTLGNRSLEIEVLQLFTGQAPTYLEALRSARTEKAWRDAAHTIKGSARAVGALSVGRAAEYAESLKSSPDRNRKAAAVEALALALADAERFIADLARSSG